MVERKKRTNPFIVWDEPVKGQTGFDTEYKSIEILDKVVKTGEGEDDFVIQKYVKETFTPIRDVIDADKDSVGVENILRQVLRTGDTSLLPADNGKCNVDLVGAPESLMELKQMGVDAQAQFDKLPEELTQGLDMAAFINGMSQEKFDAFVKAIADRQQAKEGEKVNE